MSVVISNLIGNLNVISFKIPACAYRVSLYLFLALCSKAIIMLNLFYKQKYGFQLPCSYFVSASFVLLIPLIKIIFQQNIIFPRYAAGAWQFFAIVSYFLLVLKNATHFGAPKYPKRFVNPTMSLLRKLTRIKKTAALRFVFNIFFKIKSLVMNTKPLRLRFVSAIFIFLHLFF